MRPMPPIDNDLAGRDVPDTAARRLEAERRYPEFMRKLDIKMDDEALATAIRTQLSQLRQAIVAARAAGLTVQVPAMTGNWLDTGHAPGEPSYWKIKRDSL